MKDKRRFYKEIIHGRKWHNLREWYIARHPFCEECLKAGILDQMAEEVHHVTPIGTGHTREQMLALAYDPGNLEAVCHDCHEKLHKAIKTKQMRGGRNSDPAVSKWMDKMFGI